MTGRGDPYRNYRRYARYARRSLRRGGLPVIMAGHREPLGLIALAAVSRWCYRHRSAFVPFEVLAVAFAVAAIAHRHHPGLWIAALITTACLAFALGMPHRVMRAHPSMKRAAGILGRAREACGISRPAERAYAAAVTAVTGLWLTAATGLGPQARPLPAIALIATVILGIPWWVHRRRRARVRVVRTIQAWPGLAEHMGLPGSQIASAVADQWGWTARVSLRKGTTAAHAVNQVPAIESGLGIKPGTAHVIPDPARADHVTLRVTETDPHANPIPWREPPAMSITEPVDLGLFEDGSPVLASILRLHVLIAGTTGGGKSGIVSIFAAALAKCADTVRWGIDMKGGMELRPWAPTLHRLATTPEQAAAMLAGAVAELERRAALLASLGLRTWTPAPDAPAMVILIDEYAELPPGALGHADSIARRGRAVAITLIAATQRPTQDAMGHNAVRSLMDVRICLRVRERRDTDLILGQGALSTGWDAHALTKPGTFLINSPAHALPRRARAYLITDDQVSTHATRHALARASADTHASASPGAHGAERPPAAPARPSGQDEPAGAEAVLWAALNRAGPDGITPNELAMATGMGRSWIHRQLREHAAAGRITQVRYGRWRGILPPDITGCAQ